MNLFVKFVDPETIIMRLGENEKMIIINTARKFFGESTVVVLFGSRVKDELKGGDIDLMIKPGKYCDSSEMLEKKLHLLIELEKKLGEQKIDVLIAKRNDKRKIVKTANNEGIIIC